MKITMLRSARALACAGLLFTAGAARAVDGVIEINHTSATATGYPVVIAVSGSYVLTSNLTPPAGLGAISVTTDDVTIDLNGFAILGSGGPGGVLAPGKTGITVRDGEIRGFGGPGIEASADAKVFNTRISGNVGGIVGVVACLIVENTITGNAGGDGIAGDGCKIENNVIEGNGRGIVGLNHVIVHNRIAGNGGGGIFAPGGCTIQQNVITNNGAFGIGDGPPAPPLIPPPVGGPPRNNVIGNVIDNNLSGPGITMIVPALITDNTISNNFREGIRCGAACTIRGNVVETNNLSLLGVGGVTTGPGSNVSQNNISYNLGTGLTLPITAGYSNNVMHLNSGAEVIPAAHPTETFDNLCDGAAC